MIVAQRFFLLIGFTQSIATQSIKLWTLKMERKKEPVSMVPKQDGCTGKAMSLEMKTFHPPCALKKLMLMLLQMDLSLLEQNWYLFQFSWKLLECWVTYVIIAANLQFSETICFRILFCLIKTVWLVCLNAQRRIPWLTTNLFLFTLLILFPLFLIQKCYVKVQSTNIRVWFTVLDSLI